eukprot:3136735-Amphidinium_carterae.1
MANSAAFNKDLHLEGMRNAAADWPSVHDTHALLSNVRLEKISQSGWCCRMHGSPFHVSLVVNLRGLLECVLSCLLYTSDAADDTPC